MGEKPALESHHHLCDRFTEVSLSGNSVMAQGSHTLFTVKHLSLPPSLSKTVMACFRIARLFHTSYRTTHIQLSARLALSSIPAGKRIRLYG
ncbi:MAG: hypothetical protein K1W38_03410 [Lachnospiraceae bacterium]